MVWQNDALWYLMQGLKAGQGGGKGASSKFTRGGWQGGQGQKWKSKTPAKPPTQVMDDAAWNKVNTIIKYTGVVKSYSKLDGYGFIIPDRKGLVPGDQLFVAYTEIKSSDRYPMLRDGMKVKFNLKKEEHKGKKVVHAKDVTNEGGQPIQCQDEADGEMKTFVGGQYLRYSGTMKFYLDRRGYGYIEIDEGYDYDGKKVGKEIRAEASEMNWGSGKPKMLKNVQVEFGIWETKTKEAFKAYNVTLPGGEPLEGA